MSGPTCLLREILTKAEDQAANAAERNKPAMWAYWIRIRQGLAEWFSDVADEGDDWIASAALALCQKAERECPRLPPSEAADLWALSVYGYQILRSGVPDTKGLRAMRNLAWLKDRAGEAA